MSQESEDYITPIFPVPLVSKEEVKADDLEEEVAEVELDESELDDDYAMVGGAARRLWPTIEKYRQQFLTMFGIGYSTTIGGTFLPVLTLSGLVPNENPVDKKRDKLPEPSGNQKETGFDILKQNLYDFGANKGIYAIKELKQAKDFGEYPKIFSKSSATTPVFYLSIFLTKATELALELDKKATITDEEKNKLLLLGEIIVRLYILSYINIYTQNQFCVDKPDSFKLYQDFVQNGMKQVKKFSELTAALKKDLDNDTSGIKVCLFGKDVPLQESKIALEALYDLLKDFGMIYFFNDVLNVKPAIVQDYSKSYFFADMNDFLEQMEKSAKEAETANEAAKKKKEENGDAGAKAGKEVCTKLKGEIDAIPGVVKNKLTKANLDVLSTKGYTKESILECFKDTTIFPVGEYSLEPEPSPPPPAFTKEQEDLVKTLIVASPGIPKIPKNFILKKLEESKFKEKITLEIVKKVFEKMNKEQAGLGLAIDESDGDMIPNSKYTILASPPDGWCFYHSVIRQIGADGKKLNAPTAADNAVTKAFITEIKNWMQTVLKDKEKTDIKLMYDFYNGAGAFDTYIAGLDDEAKKLWADPDFGIGLASAFVKHADIQIYIQKDSTSDFEHVIDYTYAQAYSVSNDSTRGPKKEGKPIELKLLYINKNHYDILVDNKKEDDASASASASASAAAAAAESSAAGLSKDETEWRTWFTTYNPYIYKSILSFTKDAADIQTYLTGLAGDNALTPAEKTDIDALLVGINGTGKGPAKAKESIDTIKEKITKGDKVEMFVKIFGDQLFEMNYYLKKMKPFAEKIIALNPNEQLVAAANRILSVAEKIPEARLEGDALSKASNAAATKYEQNLKAVGVTGDYSAGTLGDYINKFPLSGGAAKRKASRKMRKQNRKTRKSGRSRNTRRKNRKA